MKKLILAAVCASLMVSPLVNAGEAALPQIEEARALAKQFGGQLKPTLGGALKSGGPVNGIEVCHTKAPEIAQQLADSSGWDINRVSLKHRGETAQPDAWEIEVLTRFDRERAEGKDPKTIEFAEMTNENGQQVFRYMKAIPTGGVCLTCHGEAVSPQVKEAIAKYYPGDLATGYKKGELRGAFSFKKTIYPELGATAFTDQWDKPLAITNQTQWLVFSKTKEAGNWIKDSFNELGLVDLKAKNLAYIADVSAMPSLITKWFALPKMQDYAFSMGLVYEDEQVAHWPYVDEAAMVYQLNDGEIVKATEFRNQATLLAFLKAKLN